MYKRQANAPDRADVFAALPQLRAQGADVYVHRPGLAHVVRAPDPLQQLIPGKGPAGMLQKELEQFKFLQRQLHPGVPGVDLSLIHI